MYVSLSLSLFIYIYICIYVYEALLATAALPGRNETEEEMVHAQHE
jgi:hypothetical protein